MIGCLRNRVRKQPIIALYFESETVLKFYNIEDCQVSVSEGTVSLEPLLFTTHTYRVLKSVKVRQRAIPMEGFLGILAKK